MEVAEMKKLNQVMCIAGVGLLSVGLAAQSTAPQQPMQHDKKPMQGEMHAKGTMKAAQVIASWKPAPKAAAEKMIEKYGEPAEVTSMRIIWHDNGPWKYTEIMNKEIDHNFPIPHKDAMHQAVNYNVDPSKADEILQFDGSIILNRTAGMIGAICDKEPANFLALNLAHEVATGEKSVDEARKQYAMSIETLMKEKKMDKYTSGLIFTPPAKAGFADEPFGPIGTSGKK
jgi:hypothetical protein